MAFWKPTKFEFKAVNNAFGKGVNTYFTPFEIDENQLTDSFNMCADNMPAISVRPGRANYASTFLTTNLNGLGQRDNQYVHIVDGNTWKYWNPATTAYVTVTTSIGNGEGRFAEFATGNTLYTLFLNSTERLAWDGTTALPVSMTTNCPAGDYITSHKGRIYAAKNKILFHSALQKTTDWVTAGDAGNITVTNARGNITAIREYSDHIVVFTENSMHELYGTAPVDFTLQDVTNEIGCVSDKTLKELKGTLMWLDFEGIYAYVGAKPKKISDAVKFWIEGINLTYKSKCCAGVYKDKYYLAIPFGTSATKPNILITYDMIRDAWHTEDCDFVDFVTIANTLYGLRSTGQLVNMASGTVDASGDISWYFITKAFNESSIENKKVMTDITAVYSAASSGSMTIAYSTDADSTAFTTLATSTVFTYDGTETVSRIRLALTALQNVEWFRLKISGTAPATFHQLQRNVRIKRVT